MQNIESILEEFGLKVPDEKAEAFGKKFHENYKTVAEYDKQGDKLTAAIARAEKAEGILQGFGDDVDPAQVLKDLADAKESLKTAKEDFDKQLADRDFDDALEAALKDVKFSSESARRDVMGQVKAAGLPGASGAGTEKSTLRVRQRLFLFSSSLYFFEAYLVKWTHGALKTQIKGQQRDEICKAAADTGI